MDTPAGGMACCTHELFDFAISLMITAMSEKRKSYCVSFKLKAIQTTEKKSKSSKELL